MEKKDCLIIILVVLLCIVIYQFFYCMENFETNTSANIDNTPTLYIFITKTCPHCVDYNNNTHPKLESILANTNIKLKKIYADEDPEDLFKKYDVQYVPAFYCVKGNKKVKVDQVDSQSLIKNFNSM